MLIQILGCIFCGVGIALIIPAAVKSPKPDIVPVPEELSLEDIKREANEVFEGCDSCTEAEKQFYINGFISGYFSGLKRN